MGSPWEAALGEDVELLHPRLRSYFGEMPLGFVGRIYEYAGHFTYEIVET